MFFSLACLITLILWYLFHDSFHFLNQLLLDLMAFREQSLRLILDLSSTVITLLVRNGKKYLLSCSEAGDELMLHYPWDGYVYIFIYNATVDTVMVSSIK